MALREIIFDTETTGLDNREDRIIEIGGIELVDHFPTGRTIHLYINADGRKVHPDALAVHGISDESLADKPKFAEVAQEILDFFGDGQWIAHNATFDMGFVNAELARLNLPPIEPAVHGGIYEMRVYGTKLGSLQHTIDVWEQAVPARTRRSPLVGAMYALDGDTPRFLNIWPYASVDERSRIRAEAVKDGIWPPKGGPAHLTTMESTICVPAPFSPLR